MLDFAIKKLKVNHLGLVFHSIHFGYGVQSQVPSQEKDELVPLILED